MMMLLIGVASGKIVPLFVFREIIWRLFLDYEDFFFSARICFLFFSFFSVLCFIRCVCFNIRNGNYLKIFNRRKMELLISCLTNF